MIRREDISNDLGEAIVAVNQSGEGYKAISKQFVHHSTVRRIIPEWKTFETAVFSRWTSQQVDCVTFIETSTILDSTSLS